MKVRPPAFAGSWYAGTPNRLRSQIEESFTNRLGPGSLPLVVENGSRNLIGLVCPHAGYIYSGPVAAYGYYQLARDGKPDVIVIFSPNHTGRGSALAVVREGAWRTPLGYVEIDTDTADKILEESQIVDVDETAHAYEHSIELQLPFLQYLYGSDFKFVPLTFMMQDLMSSREVGTATAQALSGKNALVIASTDMSHYEPQARAEKKDRMALDAAVKMDEEQYYSIIESEAVSSCGYGPTIAAITASKELGAKKGKLLCYRTSGDITGDYYRVVGYASIAFTKS